MIRFGTFAVAALAIALVASAASAASPSTATSTNKAPAAANMPAASSDNMAASSATTMKSSQNIVQTCAAASSCQTLSKLLQLAGLTETLSGPGPFTVFAPTDAAFAKLPKAELDRLMSPAGKQDLTKILTFHVLSTKWDSSTLADNKTLTGVRTAQGSSLPTISKSGQSIMIGSAKVTGTPVMASNGTVYMIDSVLMPTTGSSNQM
ncbi:MAG: fasciclin domain-containing protein [Dongiaceae bacterium]